MRVGIHQGSILSLFIFAVVTEEVQVVAAWVRAAWMKFRELGGILCMRGASLRMKGVVYKACIRSMLTYGAETWAMKAGVF